jgi:hypothetical protein
VFFFGSAIAAESAFFVRPDFFALAVVLAPPAASLPDFPAASPVREDVRAAPPAGATFRTTVSVSFDRAFRDPADAAPALPDPADAAPAWEALAFAAGTDAFSGRLTFTRPFIARPRVGVFGVAFSAAVTVRRPAGLFCALEGMGISLGTVGTRGTGLRQGASVRILAPL